MSLRVWLQGPVRFFRGLWRRRQLLGALALALFSVWAALTDRRLFEGANSVIERLGGTPVAAELVQERDRAKEALDDADRRIAQLRAERAQAVAEARSLRQRAEAAESARAAAAARAERIGQELDRVRFRPYRGQTVYGPAVVHDTVSRAMAGLRMIAELDSATMAAGGVPWFGTAVIAKSAARNARSLCEAARDLVELDRAFAAPAAATTGGAATELCARRAPTPDELWSEIRSTPVAVWERARKKLADLPPLVVDGPLEIMFSTIDGLSYWLDDTPESERP